MNNIQIVLFYLRKYIYYYSNIKHMVILELWYI